MLTIRQTFCRLVLGLGIAGIVGCGASSKESRTDPAPAAAAPMVAQTPEAAAQVMDPATAAMLGRVRESLKQGKDPNEADPDGRTMLMLAAFDGSTELAELLLDNGAEVDLLDGAGRTAMMYAASGPFPKTVDLLLRRGADANLTDTAEGWTALMWAAAEGNAPVVETLLRHGADIGVADQDGRRRSITRGRWTRRTSWLFLRRGPKSAEPYLSYSPPPPSCQPRVTTT